MPERPTLAEATAGQKSKASDYNQNFTKMLDYIDAMATATSSYVLSYMPEQTGNAGKLLTTNGTTASWINFGGNLPSGSFIEGLIITKNSDTSIKISKGSCYDTTRIYILTLGSEATKTISSPVANKTYYVYITKQNSTIDIVIDESSTAPSGYSIYRLIGTVTLDSSGKIEKITSYGVNSESGHGASSFMLDDSAGVEISLQVGITTYTAPSDGWICVTQMSANVADNIYVKINGNLVTKTTSGGTGGWAFASTQIPVLNGTFIEINIVNNVARSYAVFFPMKGA